MDPQRIIQLAKLLRNNGDKILNSGFILTLSGPLICALNDSFTVIADSQQLDDAKDFQVLKTLNFKSSVFRDLQLIHDFIQKTPLLCITHYPGDEQFDITVDISKFHALKQLKLEKVNVKRIQGIQHLRSQIQELICTKCLSNIDEILKSCGGDNSNGFIWNQLKLANFSYNNLQSISTSLELAQNLQYLDLQHNHLESIDAVKWLPNLKSLNASYNRLQQSPQFHSNACKTLQTLIMNNNLIDNLNGINKLEALTHLDVGENCLLTHNALLPISALVTLKFLNLTGNPLYFHPKYRSLCAMYLHKNCADVKFVLDSNLLTKSEKRLTGKKHMRQIHLMHNYVMSTTNAAEGILVTQQSSNNGSDSASSSVTSNSFNASKTKHSGKAYKPRNVVISDSSLLEARASNAAATSKHMNDNISNAKAPDPTTHSNIEEDEEEEEHSKTKLVIDNFREKYGDEWLLAGNAEKLVNVLGVPSYSSVHTSSTPPNFKQIIHEFLNPLDNKMKQNSMPSNSDLENITEGEVLNTEASAIPRNEIETSTNLLNDFSPTGRKSIYESSEGEICIENEDDDSQMNSPRNDLSTNCVANEELSEAESDEETYLVTSVNSQQAILLTKSTNYLREKDPITKRTRTKWNLQILESCDRLKSNVLRINFDTVKVSKQERRYIIEQDICQDLENKLRSLLSKRLLSEMYQNVYHCVNCSCQFSVEIKYPQAHLKITCPNCKSAFVAKDNALEDSLENVDKQPPKSTNSSFAHESSNAEALQTDSIGDYENKSGGKAACREIDKADLPTTDSKASQSEQPDLNADATPNPRKKDASSSPSLSTSHSTSISVVDNLNNSRNSSANISSSDDDNRANLTSNSSVNIETKQNPENSAQQNEDANLTAIENQTSATDLFKFNYVDYSDVDHRIKLYFYQSKFNENNEHFKYIVRGRVFCANSSSSFVGLLIVSTHQCYLMEAFAAEDHDVNKWLREITCCSVNDLIMMQMLPWKVGFQVQFKDWGAFLLLLPSAQHTDNLILYLKTIAWPSNCQLIQNPNERVVKHLNTSVPSDEQLKLFVILNFCEISCDAAKRSIGPCSLLITDYHLYISSENFHYMLCPSNELNSLDNIELCCTQLLTNLVEVEHSTKQQINIIFLDEDHNKYAYWNCSFDSMETTNRCLRVLDQSWQQIFGVSLFNT